MTTVIMSAGHWSSNRDTPPGRRIPDVHCIICMSGSRRVVTLLIISMDGICAQCCV